MLSFSSLTECCSVSTSVATRDMSAVGKEKHEDQEDEEEEEEEHNMDEPARDVACVSTEKPHDVRQL